MQADGTLDITFDMDIVSNDVFLGTVTPLYVEE
jgi:hypothetical protein